MSNDNIRTVHVVYSTPEKGKLMVPVSTVQYSTGVQAGWTGLYSTGGARCVQLLSTGPSERSDWSEYWSDSSLPCTAALEYFCQTWIVTMGA